MKITKFPIYLILIGYSAGIIIDNYITLKPSFTFALTFFTFILLLIASILAKRDFIQKIYFGGTVLLVTFSCGLLTHSLHSDENYSNHYSHHIQNEINTLQGTVSERLKPNKYAEKYYFKITKIDGEAVFGKILLNVSKKEIEHQFHSGEKIIIKGNLQPIPQTYNPYQFNYAAYLEKQNVFHQLYLTSGNYIQTDIQQNFDYYVEKYRNTLLNSFRMHHFSPETENVIRALLLGQRQDMDTQTTENYTDAGVIHVLAISGLHIAILYAMLLVFIKPLQRFKNGKLIQFLIVVGFLWLFAILSGLSASVVRSVVMFSFMSAGLLLNRSGNTYNILAVSMLFILLFKPNFLFDVGFQLSYIAVFSIVWLQPFYKSFKTSRFALVNYFIDILTLSFVAQIGVLPLSLYYFNQIPLLFFMANLVVIPISSFVLILGIVVLIFNFTLPDFANWLGKPLSFSIEIMNQYIARIASFKNLIIKDIPFSFSLLLISYLALIALILWLYKKQFLRLIFFLCTAIALQITLLNTFIQAKKGCEFVVYNNRKSTLLTDKQNNKIVVYTNDSLPQENTNLKSYNRGKFNQQIEIRPVPNVLFYAGKKILIVDGDGIYKTSQKPDIILLIQSPKINLVRAIRDIHPERIIADATNYKSYVKRWKATCEKEKIPFHATAEKGFCKIEN